MSKIRLATVKDLPQVAAIWNQVIRETMQTFTSAEKTVEGLAQFDPIFVAEIAGQVVGFATYFPFRNGPGYARTVEHSIYIAPEGQGAGIGRALMGALETHARGRGHHVMMAGISAANPGGVKFHVKAGFQIVGRLPEVGYKNGQYLDLILAQKIL